MNSLTHPSKDQKIFLYLMNRRGLIVLKNLLHKFGPQYIAGVASSRDTGLIDDSFDEIEFFCKKFGILFWSRYQMIPAFKWQFAIGWRWLIESTSPIIVFHDSLLPRYRGFSPLVNQIINDEKIFGVTALFGSKDYDGGDIIAQKSVELPSSIKISDAIDAIGKLYMELAIEIAEKIINGELINSTPQEDQLATYSLWRNEDDYRINWNWDSRHIERFIRAVGPPFKGALTYVEGKGARISHSQIMKDVKIENRHVGKVIFMEEGLPVVVCGSGLLKILAISDDHSHNSLLPLKKFRTVFS